MAGHDASIVYSDRSSVRVTGPAFPKTRCSLWDKTSVGQAVLLHISHYRRPRLCVPEKILKLMQHQCENYGLDRHMLIGTLVVDDDGEGVQILVDRLDTRPNCPADSVDLASGNVPISFQVANNTAIERAASVDDYVLALKHLKSRCHSKDSIDLCGFFHLYGWGSFYSNAHSSVLHLDWDMVTMETTFMSTPVTPVPIVLTALSKNLASPQSLSSLQGAPKTGYLTMDHTRKLLLVLESDPKAAVLPVIGIWVSGVEFVHHPFVWAACLRYSHNTHLQDRVCSPPEQFLLVLYTPLHSRPEFYQCETNASGASLQFELSSGHEVVNLDKGLASPGSGSFVEVEMEPVQAGIKVDNFEAAKVKLGLMAEASSSPGQEDLEPRCAPTPHSEKVPVFQPMVPDVSILWTDSYENLMNSGESNKRQFIPQDQQKQQLPHMTAPSRIDLPVMKNNHPNSADSMGELQHVQYPPQPHILPARSPLSHHYSPSCQNGQQIPPPASHFPQQRYPTNLPSQAFHNFSVPGQTSVPLLHARGPAHQSPSAIPLPTGWSFNNVSSAQATAGSSSQGNHQSHGTFTGMQTVNERLSATVDGYYESLDRDVSRPYVGCAQHSRPRLIQNSDNSQPGAPYFPHSQATSSAASVANVLQPSPATQHFQQNPTQHFQQNPTQHFQQNPTQHFQQNPTQHFQQNPTRDFQLGRATLNTITEETTPPRFSSQKLDHQVKESQSASLKDVDTEGKGPNRSPPSIGNNNRRSLGEDSGFSVTPERHSVSVTELEASTLPSAGSRSSAAASSAAPSNSSGPAPVHLQSSIDKIQWEQIPTQVRDLLIQQHEQLQQLQLQVQLLQSQQLLQQKSASQSPEFGNTQLRQDSQPRERSQDSQPRECSQDSQPRERSHDSQPRERSQDSQLRERSQDLQPRERSQDLQPRERSQDLQPRERSQDSQPRERSQDSQPRRYSSVAVNTSFCGANSEDTRTQADCRPAQCTPGVPGRVSPPSIVGPRQLVPGAKVGPSVDTSPVAVLNTTEDASYSSHGSSRSSRVEVNQRDLDYAIEDVHVFDESANNDRSELIIDMPEYVSSVCDRSHVDDQSPSSVSDYYRQSQEDSYSSLGEDAADPKQYYSQLMKNIQAFLTNNGSPDSKSSSQALVGPDTEHQMTVSRLESSIAVPEVSSVSMLFGCGSDSWQSMEINALAMKYLTDEQLTCMAKLRQSSPSKSHKPSCSAKILQQVIGACQSSYPETSSTPDVSRLGISSSDMTLGTLMYLEKHGLLGNDVSVLEHPVMGHELQLRTDFSILTNVSTAVKTNLSLTTNGGDPYLFMDAGRPGRQFLQSSPGPNQPHINREMTKNPAVSLVVGQNDAVANNENWLPQEADLQGLAALPEIPTKSRQLAGQVQFTAANIRQRNILQEMKPQAVNNVRTRASNSPRDEEKLLDISMLKQMPKLL